VVIVLVENDGHARRFPACLLFFTFYPASSPFNRQGGLGEREEPSPVAYPAESVLKLDAGACVPASGVSQVGKGTLHTRAEGKTRSRSGVQRGDFERYLTRGGWCQEGGDGLQGLIEYGDKSGLYRQG